MAKVGGKGRDYTPLELLKMAIMGTGKKMLSPPETKAREEWEIVSPESRQQAIDELVWETLGGVGGAVKLSGPVEKSARTIKHILGDKQKKRLAKNLGRPTAEVGVVAKKMVEKMSDAYKTDSGFMNWVKDAFVGTAPLSPETIYGMEKSGAGRKIYRTLDLADQGMNRFEENLFKKFHKARGVIDKGSKGSVRVGRALDGKMAGTGKKPVKGEKVTDGLNKNELGLYGFLKKQFDFLFNRYARNTLGDENTYRKLAHAASAAVDKKPTVPMKKLNKKLKNEYDRVIAARLKRLGLKPYKDLSVKDKKISDEYSAKLKKIRHKGWVEGLGKTEKEIFGLMSRKLKNYLPHIFDKDELLKGLNIEREILEDSLRLSTETKEITKIKKRLVSINTAISKLKGGELITYEQLPQNVRFKFFDPRKGASGYSFDAVKAFESYARGMGKKLYQEPALKKVGNLYKQLSPRMRRYTKQHVKDWLGMERTAGKELADAVTTTQWMLKLGINPRSAITNAAQRVNTLAETGEKNAIRGYFKGWTKEGDELFRKTGLAQEVPTVLLEGQVPEKLAWMKDKLGWMFTKMEIGNRKHAFLSGIEQGKGMGLKGQELIQHGIDVVHKTQFRYSAIGMPAPLRTAPGKVMFQFWSYPIKQMEFLAKLLKNDPKKLAKWALYAEGGRQALKEGAGVDLGNALGLGLNYEEVAKSLKAIPDGDFEGMFRHMKLASQGGGIVPGLSPTPSALLKIGEGLDKGLGEGAEALGKELTPVQVGKMWKGYKGLEGVQEGKEGEKRYPWRDSRGGVDTYLSGPELASEVFGPKTVKVKETSEQKAEDFSYKRLKSSVEKEARDLYTEGSPESIIKAIKLLGSIGAEGKGEQIEKGMIRRELPYEVRKQVDMTDQDRIMRVLNP